MSLSKELDKMKYDKRLMDWYVSRGHMSKADQQKYLDSLPDLASNVESFSIGGHQASDDTPMNGGGPTGDWPQQGT